jgi:hypothetical protein
VASGVARRTLVILAGRWDDQAHALARRWAFADAVVLSPIDLSRRGWRYYPGNPRAHRAVIDDRPLDVREIGAVLVRLPCVSADELSHIRASDRAYVAEEMTAFLLAWLTELPCPVVNRPTASCLAGPAFRAEQWVQLASSCGIPCQPVRRHVRLNGSGEQPNQPAETTVTVVGRRQLGDPHAALAERAALVAAAAGTDVLTVTFDGADADARFVGAHLWPDTDRDDVADGLLEFLLADFHHAGARHLRVAS